MLPLLIGAAALYFVAKNKGNAAEQLSYQVTGGSLDRHNSNLQQLAGNLKVAITNPTPTKFSFKTFSGTAAYKGAQIGTINYTQAVTIEPQKVTSIDMPVIISTRKAGSSAFKIIKALFKKENPTLDIAGTINFAAGSLKVNSQMEFQIV